MVSDTLLSFFSKITIRFFSIDNSEYQRNGDFPPSRMYAQKNAANMIAKAKTSGNKESSVGVLSMAE